MAGELELLPNRALAYLVGHDAAGLAGRMPAPAASFDFLAFRPGLAADIKAGVDVTTDLQNFLLYCQRIAWANGARQTGDQSLMSGVRAVCSATAPIYITSPIVVPEFVHFDFATCLMRDGRSGTVTANYTGDTTSKALANLYQPGVLVTPRAHVPRLQLNGNPGSNAKGAGLFMGKIWAVKGAAPAAGGSGYAVGNTITLANPSISPFKGATATVSSVDGNGAVTGLTIVDAGVYGLPPVLQAMQWTVANGFTATFDGSGNFLTTGGAGTGLTVAATWFQDWEPGNTRYAQFLGGGVYGGMTFGSIWIENCGFGSDATYGKMRCVTIQSIDILGDRLKCGGGKTGFFAQAADCFINMLNVIGSESMFEITTGGGDFNCPNVILNATSTTKKAITLDQTQGVILKGRIFNDASATGMTGSPIDIGLGSNINNLPVGCDLDFEVQNCGSTGDPTTSSAVVSVDFARGCRFNIKATNFDIKTGVRALYPHGALFNFGANLDGSNTFEGSLDQTPGPIAIGTMPPGELELIDGGVPVSYAGISATVAGTVTTGDVSTLTFTNGDISALPVNVSYTSQAGDTTTLVAAGLVAAINANATLTALGVIAATAGASFTIKQPGAIANKTTMTAVVRNAGNTAAGTETITTFPGSGLFGNGTPGVSGGRVKAGGIYDLTGSGYPTAATGFGKAPLGSIYLDKATGSRWMNNGTASAPTWRVLTGLAVLALDNTAQPAVTGVTTETLLKSIAIPAGVMTAKSMLRVTALVGVTGSNAARTVGVRFATSATAAQGANVTSLSLTSTQQSAQIQSLIRNRDLKTQVYAPTGVNGYAASSGSDFTGTVDTTQTCYVNLYVTPTSAADSFVLDSYCVELLEG